MRRRNFLRAMGMGAAAVALPRFGFPAEQTPNKPNILFIFADDQTYAAINALGCDEIHTPNLNRLVRSGVTFTHAYNMGAWHGAVCVASRTMLNTGRFLWQAKAIEPKLGEEAKAGRLWAQYMNQAGYDTYFSGKWHVKIKPDNVFDHVVHERPGMPNQTDAGYNRPIEGEPDPWSPYDPKFEGYWKGGKHWSEVLGDDGVAYLEQAGQNDTPFFMYLAFNAPHDPRQSPKKYVDMYPADEIDVPANYMPEYPYKDAIGCGKSLRDEKLAPFPRTEYAIKVNRQEYYAIISHMGGQVGRILDALEETGKADNTYIFFTAVHGLAVGHHGLMGKQNMYDHSMRAPLMVCGPGIPKDKRIEARVYLQDIMPTTLELAGTNTPEYVRFKSLMPLIDGRRKENYDAIYGAYMNLQRMVTDDNFKLVWYPKIDKYLLFNLKKDPLEVHDLSGNERYAKRLEQMKTKLRALQEEMNDPLLKKESGEA
ncbi:MAG: sulfatase-like hydrolase/transferase [Candidatus Hydrogenedentota bacterium]